MSKRRLNALKVLALLSQIRWYNILLLLLGQYLAALYVFADKYARVPLLTDAGTHLSIWASTFLLASGFLINTFYDLEADSINRPRQTSFERLVRKSTSLRVAWSSPLVFGRRTNYGSTAAPTVAANPHLESIHSWLSVLSRVHRSFCPLNNLYGAHQ